MKLLASASLLTASAAFLTQLNEITAEMQALAVFYKATRAFRSQ